MNNSIQNFHQNYSLINNYLQIAFGSAPCFTMRRKIPNKVSLYKNTNRVVIFRGRMSELIIFQIIRDFEKYRKGKVSLTLGGCSDNVYKIKTNTFKARSLNQKILHPIFNIPIRYVSKIKTGLLERKMSMLKISIHNFPQS